MNNLHTYGRWAFAEFCDVYEMQADFETKVEEHFNKMIESATTLRKETLDVMAPVSLMSQKMVTPLRQPPRGRQRVQQDD